MRKLFLRREDFELFHQDINPHDYEYYRSHAGAFKRMWQDQTRRFWQIFVSTFEYFIWNYGVMKDFPLKADEVRECVDEIIFYIRDQFVDGKAGTARALLMDCVIVTQNRHCLGLLDKASYASNPFYMRDTREIFRKLFGPPDSKRTYMKVLCGLPVYIKFAGAAVVMLRRWLDAEEVPSDDEVARDNFLESIHDEKVRSYDSTSEAKLHQALAIIQHERQQDKIVQSLAKYGGRMGPFEPPVPQPMTRATLELKAGKWKEKKSAARSKRAREKRAEEKTEGSKKAPEEKLKDDKPAPVDLKESSDKKEASATNNGDPPSSATPTLPDSTLQSGNKTEPGADKAELGTENGAEAGAEVVKKKKRRRKKKRGGVAGSSPLEDGLGLDEDTLSPPLPDPIAEDKEKGEIEEKGKDEVSEVKEEKVEEVEREVKEKEEKREMVEKEEEKKGRMMEKEKEEEEKGGMVEKEEEEEEKGGMVEKEEKKEIVEKEEEEKREKEEEETIKTDTLEVKKKEAAMALAIETELPTEGKPLACDEEESSQANDMISSEPSLIQPTLTNAGDTHMEEREEEKEKNEGKKEEKEEVEKEEEEEEGEGEEEASVVDDEEQSRLVVAAEGGSSKKRLHTCGFCGCKETTAKSFKRCQKCRGKPDPKYYCSRDCQGQRLEEA